MFGRTRKQPDSRWSKIDAAQPARRRTARKGWPGIALAAWLPICGAAALAQQPHATPQTAAAVQHPPASPRIDPAAQQPNRPPRVVEAERFLALRGWTREHGIAPRASALRSRWRNSSPRAFAQTAAGASASPSAATWSPLGPAAVQTPDFGLVTGRVTALALDPSDPTGNRLYAGTTGGGVWLANNAGVSTPASIVFNPLTDNVTALGGVAGASISIGALTVQPGETGVILAGTGDPNDALDSYYGAGILRSTDGGNTWSLIAVTDDVAQGLSGVDASFIGEGFAGFAWSTANPQVVVAAVAQAFEGTLVNAGVNASSQGLYYSADSGATWHLATITDGAGEVVQGPGNQISANGGNSATAVVWNAVRQVFVAAVRYHGYYQSADGVTWTRLAAQPGTGLTTAMCPTNSGGTGSIACPIFRGALAVNPESGDTFAWTVDLNDQDQGLWQDQCQISDGICASSSFTFAQQWNTSTLENTTPSSILQGPATIADGVYNLALAAVPSQQDTLLLAGANDLWKCSLAMGCVWRNTTNAFACAGSNAQVGAFQHVVAWPDLAWSAYPAQQAGLEQEIFLGNDSGLWRSTDAVGVTGAGCSASDATHFQNLNGSLGSLAEAQSLSAAFDSGYLLLAGLGANGAAGVNSGAVPPDWPQVLSGYGGPVAIDPNSVNTWYVNDQAGVAIYSCTENALCTPADFGTSALVTDADVGGDGYEMTTPAPFLVDPLDPSQLLIGTCRVWRGPADGSGWSASNAISPIFDSGATGVACNGDALVRSLAAMRITDQSEVVYAGTYGLAYNGTGLPGHVLTAMVNPSSAAAPVWTDLTGNPVLNTPAFNQQEFGVSSVTIDPHDGTGNTVYATIEGMPSASGQGGLVYGSTNGGASWIDLSSNLPNAPVNSLAVDPGDANTVYLATDAGVFYTAQVSICGQTDSNCWSVFGAGLPGAPAVSLSASSSASPPVLVAATYGRGIWQTGLWSSQTAITAASAAPANVAFEQTPAVGVASQPVQVQLANTGSLPLTVTSIAMAGADPGDFSETDNCQTPPASSPVAAGGTCTIDVTFTPQMANIERTAVMTIYANVYSGQLTVDLTGTGVAATGSVTLNPSNLLAFSPLEVGNTSAPLPVTLSNSGGTALAMGSVTATPPFLVPPSGNSCGSSVAPNTSCAVQVEFAPTQAGVATGLLTFTDAAGAQMVNLTGTGQAAPTDILNPTSLSFSPTPIGQSASLTFTITNTGDLALTGLSLSVASTPAGQFQATSGCGTQVAAQHPGICTITVQFAPSQTGAITGTITVTDYTTQTDTQRVSLSATGLAAPAFSVNPPSLNFANQQPGVASAPQTLTITNSGGAPMANVGFAIAGAAAADYSIASNTCGAELGNGSSCAMQIVFTPNATGAIAATLALSSSTQDVTPVSVPLNGSGQLLTGLTTSPPQIDFPVLGAGQSSQPQTVTVTNASSYSIASVALATVAPFSVAQNNCTGNLAAGASCTAAVVFQPTASGSSSGTLTVSSAAVADPATVALSGTGFDFALGISGPSSQTVAGGQQADYTLVICGGGGCAQNPTLAVGGSFAFSCGTLPEYALCLFKPSTESLNAGVEGNVEVEISTGSSSSASAAQVSAVTGRRDAWPALPLACGLVLLPLVFRARRKMFLLAVLAAIVAAGVASCTGSGGGGTGGSGGGSTTPPGNYTIPVTVTSTGVSHSFTLSLTVD
jgi:hypothetical protein